MTHLRSLILHIDIPLLREVSVFTKRDLHGSSLLGGDDGAVLRETAKKGGDVGLALGRVDASTRGNNLEGPLPGLGVHLFEHVTLTRTLRGAALRRADREGDRVEVISSHLLHGTLGCLLEDCLDTVDLLVALLDEERTTIRLENHASLGVQEFSCGLHFCYTIV